MNPPRKEKHVGTHRVGARPNTPRRDAADGSMEKGMCEIWSGRMPVPCPGGAAGTWLAIPTAFRITESVCRLPISRSGRPDPDRRRGRRRRSCRAGCRYPPCHSADRSPTRRRALISGAAESVGHRQYPAGLVRADGVVPALAECLDQGRVGHGRGPARDGDGPAVYQDLPAASRLTVIVLSAPSPSTDGMPAAGATSR